jgi:transcriptional regulator with XRE-family HTH domain
VLPLPAVAIRQCPQHRRVLGEAIRSYRKDVKMSQEKLAEKSELNPKYIGEVERGGMNISMDALVRIARALKVRVNDLTREF